MMSSRRIRCGYLYVKLLSVAAVAVSLCGFFFFASSTRTYAHANPLHQGSHSFPTSRSRAVVHRHAVLILARPPCAT